MARVDLTVRQMTLICQSIELHAEQLAEDHADLVDNVSLALELSLIHLELLKACRDSFLLDQEALRQEYDA